MVIEKQIAVPSQSVLVDGHVHIHDCFDLGVLFKSAQQNSCIVAGQLGLGNRFSAILLLTESYGDDYYSDLRKKAAEKTSIDGWRVATTTESESLLAIGPNDFELTIIAGRQIVTADRLEVLALCTDRTFEDGGATSEVIDSVSAAGGIAVVPWGFGKWTGRRKKLINDLIGEFAERPFHLGDNSGRVSVWREPTQFARARSQGQWVFRGTDPLPFPHQETRIGRFGFFVNGPFRKSQPAASMRNLLDPANADSTPPTSYGALESPVTFVKHQLMMQARKRRPDKRLDES